jgi:PRTRC genetic system ThiF family protein
MLARRCKNSSSAEMSAEELAMETHRIHLELLERQVRVLVVGCGGTGCSVVAGLPYLHQSLVARGHPGGLHVTVMDGDIVSPTNCVRQPFSRSEVGLNKAVVLLNRLNLFWGLKWEAVPAHLKSGSHISRSYSGDDLRAHIVIGCVDTRAARAAIRDAVSKWSTVSYWLDLGNNADSGQFILGEPLNERNRRAKLRLRSAAEIFPEIADPNLDNDGEPSCSSAEALERQEPFVNSTLAQHALAPLARLFRYGEISYHGGFTNLASGVTSVLRIDPKCWKRTRRLNRHTPPPRQRQDDGSDGEADQSRVK